MRISIKVLLKISG